MRVFKVMRSIRAAGGLYGAMLMQSGARVVPQGETLTLEIADVERHICYLKVARTGETISMARRAMEYLVAQGHLEEVTS